MRERTVGHFILNLRIEKNIKQKELCEGLCSVQTLSQIEKGERFPEVWVFDRFIQRLGKSPDKFETILSDAEYDELETWRQIDENLDKGLLQEAEQQLEEYINNSEGRGSIQQQYYYQTKAVIEKWKNQHEKSKEYLLRSVSCTLPNLNNIGKLKVLMCVKEIELLLMYADEMLKTGEQKEAARLVHYLLEYMENHYSDDGELAKIYPKGVYLLFQCERNEKDGVNLLERCKKAFQLLINENSSVFLVEIMELLVQIYKEMRLQKNASQIEVQLETLKEVYSDYGFPTHTIDSSTAWFQESLRREYHLCSELVRGEREARYITREELIVGIYDNPENLARIEAGHQMPNANNYIQLMRALGLPESRYNSYVVTDDYKVLELQKKINALLFQDECEAAKIELEKLKLTLDNKSPVNRQYLLLNDACLDYELKVIDEKEFYERTKAALEITYKGNLDEKLRVPLRQEATVLNQLAVSLCKQGNSKEGLSLFKSVVNCYRTSKVDERCHYLGLSPILLNMMQAMRVAGEVENAREMVKSLTTYLLDAKKCGAVYSPLVTLANIYESEIEDEKEKKKAMARVLRQAFYLSELFGHKENHKIVDSFYRRCIDKNGLK